MPNMNVLENIIDEISQSINYTEDDTIENTNHYLFLLKKSGKETHSLIEIFVMKWLASELYKFDNHGFMDVSYFHDTIEGYLEEASSNEYDELFEYYFNHKTNTEWDEDVEEVDAVLKLNTYEQLSADLVVAIFTKSILNEIQIQVLKLQQLLLKQVEPAAWHELFEAEEDEYEIVDGVVKTLLG